MNISVSIMNDHKKIFPHQTRLYGARFTHMSVLEQLKIYSLSVDSDEIDLKQNVVYGVKPTSKQPQTASEVHIQLQQNIVYGESSVQTFTAITLYTIYTINTCTHNIDSVLYQ